MVNNSVLLTNGVVIPLSALVIQRFTTRQVFLTGILIFFVGTIVGGFRIPILQRYYLQELFKL